MASPMPVFFTAGPDPAGETVPPLPRASCGISLPRQRPADPGAAVPPPRPPRPAGPPAVRPPRGGRLLWRVQQSAGVSQHLPSTGGLLRPLEPGPSLKNPQITGRPATRRAAVWAAAGWRRAGRRGPLAGFPRAFRARAAAGAVGRGGEWVVPWGSSPGHHRNLGPARRGAAAAPGFARHASSSA